MRETGLNCDGVREFLRYTHDNNVPLDFLSTHGYADENYEQDAPGEHHAPRSDARQHPRSVSQDGQPAVNSLVMLEVRP